MREHVYEGRALLFTFVFCAPVIPVLFLSPFMLDRVLLIFFPFYGYTPPSDKLWEALTFAGYINFFIIASLIVVSVLARKRKLTFLGSVSLFLPTYGYFAFTMWGLQFAGVAVARMPYLPIMVISPGVLRLGEAIYLPTLFNLWIVLFWVFFGYIIGFAFLSAGTYDWILGKLRHLPFVCSGIYRYVRHPQYLAYLMLSYTLLLSASFGKEYHQGFQGWPPPSLPWVVSALLIIGLALHEENVMIRKLGKKYSNYRNRTSFMLPLPRWLSRVLVSPCRCLFKRDLPETGSQIAALLLLYGLVIVALSAPIMLFWQWP